MEDEAEIYDGVRAQFPLSFGKQSKPQTSLEAIHSTTRRSTTTATATATTNKTDELPSLSSSSKDWLSSLRNPNSNSSTNEDEADLIGPPRPPPDDEDEDVGPIIGPPRPSAAQLESIDEEEEEEMVGPPRPPPGMSFGDSEDEVEEEEETENQYRIPLSNEIVLKGHTKVFLSLSLSNFCFFFEKLLLIAIIFHYNFYNI